jgi:hypothetical protein
MPTSDAPVVNRYWSGEVGKLREDRVGENVLSASERLRHWVVRFDRPRGPFVIVLLQRSHDLLKTRNHCAVKLKLAVASASLVVDTSGSTPSSTGPV